MKENNENCEIGFLGYWLGAVEGFFFCFSFGVGEHDITLRNCSMGNLHRWGVDLR